MFLVSVKSIEETRAIFALSGDVRSIFLPRLEMIIHGQREQGRRACFDMENVTSLEAGVILFFVEGPGSAAPLIYPPEPLRSLRSPSSDPDGGATRDGPRPADDLR